MPQKEAFPTNISSRFAVAIHILSLLEMNKGGTNTSDFLASSVNTNPVVVRRIVSMLSRAGLVQVKSGVAGARLAKEASAITLLDIYRAVQVVEENGLFAVHECPNPECPVGRSIQSAILPVFVSAQRAMESELDRIRLTDILHSIPV
ncbi:Rrf2 family transcriptional regulator [Paenibacillus sp. J31TS4]|uniref:Rrf2 family transcriptional regulator n=1 Tax=Paenibacillus sp. J31TS4 TaxID=2807195 RepID=UPI001BD07C8F|nr:Rrf2 family transcriptional regulator [Paenibacillus sp. J31TS4]